MLDLNQSNKSEDPKNLALQALDKLYENHLDIQVITLNIKQSEEIFVVDPYRVFYGDERDDFFEKKFIAAFKTNHDGLEFYFRFAEICQAPQNSEEISFDGLMIQINNLPCEDHWVEIGFSSEFSISYHKWREFFNL